MKNFQTIEELLNSIEFQEKDLSDCDLSNLDLSVFEANTWNDFVFDHTNFQNTNIFFYPESLQKGVLSDIQLEYCNFTNCDLSGWNEDDQILDFVSITGSNFTNTHLHVPLRQYFPMMRLEKDYSKVVFSEEYLASDFDDLLDQMGIDLLLLNPHFSFSSVQVLRLLQNSLTDLYSDDRSNLSAISGIHQFLQKVLDYDFTHEKKLYHFYQKFKDVFLNEENEFQFFWEEVRGYSFDELDLSDVDLELLSYFRFVNCHFNFLKLPPVEGFQHVEEYYHFFDCDASKVEISNVTLESWQKIKNKHLFEPLHLKTNLHFTIGRKISNRFSSLQNLLGSNIFFDLKEINANLSRLFPYLDHIEVQGIEKFFSYTFFLFLRRIYAREKVEWSIRTDTSLPYFKLRRLSSKGSLKVERYSMDDTINRQFLGEKTLSNVRLKRLNEVASYPITLCAPIFSENLLSKTEIQDYISYYGEDIGIQHLFFSLLQESNLSKDDLWKLNMAFSEVLSWLEENGYSLSVPIYQTDGFVLIIAKKEEQTITFQRQISAQELSQGWSQASSRMFDLSMDPSGNLYQNFHQSSDKVLLKK